MKPSRRQWYLAVFLASFALGIGLLGWLVPPFWNIVALLGWWALAVFVGLRLIREPVVLIPDLTIPENFVVPEASSEPEGTDVESVSESDSEGPAEVAMVAEEPTEPELPPELEPEPDPEVDEEDHRGTDDFRQEREAVVDLLAALEEEWSQTDVIGPSLTEVSGSSAFIKENVQRSFEIADNLAGGAQRAFALSEKVQKGVTIVTDALVESLRQTEILSEHSQRITGILELMSEVSDKIHVLSINASIVSARAGAAGKGFEVVAKEIRSLAKDTEHSLGDIVEVIELLRSSIAQVIRVVRDADLETQEEKSSLIEVAGALQGVILGVEIVKAVSSFAKDKAEDQEKVVQGLVAFDRRPSSDLRSKAAAVKARLEEWNSKE